eukprot:m.32392 g.32392  ORF g.32392 m.32392 type:complete len:499 (+) comp9516_c0_seq1:316-1812(+)
MQSGGETWSNPAVIAPPTAAEDQKPGWFRHPSPTIHDISPPQRQPSEMQAATVRDTKGSTSSSSGDDDSVWSPDIEKAFAEALKLYPPCGRRKIILSDEGKMYGRNELIARYIKLQTGKTRSRKQVSSHIQVLARKKQRELQIQVKDPVAHMQLKNTLANLTSAEIVGSSIQSGSLPQRSFTFSGTQSQDSGPSASTAGWQMQGLPQSSSASQGQQQQPPVLFPEAYNPPASHSMAHMPGLPKDPFLNFATQPQPPPSTYNGIGRLKLALDQFSAGLHYPFNRGAHKFLDVQGSYYFADPSMECLDIHQITDKFPGLYEMYQQGPKEAFFLSKFWVDMSFDPSACARLAREQADGTLQPMEDEGAFYFSCKCESLESIVAESTTTVISLGKKAVEKIQVEDARQDGQRLVYDFGHAAMCDYLTTFIQRLKHLESVEKMNSVLENFNVLLTVRNQATREVLFSMACVFEVQAPGMANAHHVYKLMDIQDEALLQRRYTA